MTNFGKLQFCYCSTINWRFTPGFPILSMLLPPKVLTFSWISLIFWCNTLLMLQMLHLLPFLSWSRATDSTRRHFSTEHLGGRGGGLLAAHCMEQAHRQGAGLWGEVVAAAAAVVVVVGVGWVLWLGLGTLQTSLPQPHWYSGSSSLAAKSADNAALHLTLINSISPEIITSIYRPGLQFSPSLFVM